MHSTNTIRAAGPVLGLVLMLAACERSPIQPATTPGLAPALASLAAESFGTFSNFTPLPSQATCVAPPATLAGFATYQPFVLPAGYTQRIIASEIDDFRPVAGSGGDLPDMITLNETGPHAGRYLYQTHEPGSNGAVTVTDLETGVTTLVTQASHYERLDGIVWSPWHTLLFAEEATAASRPDPTFPQAKRGMVYELDPATGAVAVRPAVGSRSHEGLRFDTHGNLYGISESSPGPVFSGGIFKFVPDRRGISRAASCTPSRSRIPRVRAKRCGYHSIATCRRSTPTAPPWRRAPRAGPVPRTSRPQPAPATTRAASKCCTLT